MGKFGGFQSVKLARPKRSTFDLSHERRMTVAGSMLVPILCQECIPSDKFTGSSEVLLRLAPLLAPIYEQVELFVHYYFVPNRLLWEDWEEFITAGRLGPQDGVPAPIPPYIDIGAAQAINAATWNKNTLADYLGVPVFPLTGSVIGDYVGKDIDAMPFLAYYLIYNEYYVDRNFTADADLYQFPAASGDITATSVFAGFTHKNITQLMYRMYRKDYFISALPFTQRGDEVLLPIELSGYAPVVGRANDGSIDRWNVAATLTPGGGGVTLELDADPDAPAGAAGVNDFGYANLNDVQDTGFSATINDFRSAYALQVWMERNALGGSRYTENTQAHFGVRPQDSRLQRPEYIGGGRINVKISEVVSTAFSTNASAANVPLGNMGGHGVTYGNTNMFSYFCMEHGFIMGILSIMIPPSYHQGLPRMFRRQTFLDYPWPTFAKLGEQPVNKYELFASPANLTEDVDGEYPLFGYQSRYADWKYKPTSNHGDFHDTLLFWTGTINFGSSPTLGESFLLPPSGSFNRWFAAPAASACNFWLYIHNRVHAKRPLPYFGTPNTLGFA